MPGVRVLPDSNPPRVYSSHGGDVLADGHAHDSFDLYRLLEHGGDWKSAVKAAAALLGMSARHGATAGEAEPEQAEWVEPELIRNELLPVAPIHEEMIPEPLRPWLVDIAQRKNDHITLCAEGDVGFRKTWRAEPGADDGAAAVTTRGAGGNAPDRHRLQRMPKVAAQVVYSLKSSRRFESPL